jgi:hypothetical protein
MGVYAVCLLTGSTFTSIAGVIGIWWLAKRSVVAGPMCTTQAVFMSIGNTSTAYFTVAIAVHSFNSLVLRYRQSTWAGLAIILVGWTFALSISFAPLSPLLEKGAMYGPGDLTCGVQSIYIKALFYHHLLPIFLASMLSVILYSLAFLVLRGTLIIRGGIRLNFDPNHRWDADVDDIQGYFLAIAKSMLWYPVAYVALLLPYSITRLLILSGFDVPTGISMFAFACWYMLGVVNVLLLYNTFHVLVPALLKRPFRKLCVMENGHMPSVMAVMLPPKPPPKDPMHQISHVSKFRRSFTARSVASSVRSLVADHPSIADTDDRRSSTQSSFIQRAPSPLSVLYSDAIVVPEPISRSPDTHSRTASLNSTLTFQDTPPNRVRYPAIDGHRNLNGQKGKWENLSRSSSAQPSAQTLPRNVNSLHVGKLKPNSEHDSFDIGSFDISGWLTQQTPDDFLPPPRPPKRPPPALFTSQAAVLPSIMSPLGLNRRSIVDALPSSPSVYTVRRSASTGSPNSPGELESTARSVTKPESF